jgi:hypothetical protein
MHMPSVPKPSAKLIKFKAITVFSNRFCQFVISAKEKERVALGARDRLPIVAGDWIGAVFTIEFLVAISSFILRTGDLLRFPSVFDIDLCLLTAL